MTRRHLPGALLAASSLALLLSACTSPAPSPSAEPTATSSPTASAEPSPEPTAAPTATCDTVFTEAENAELAADGLEPEPEVAFPLGAVMTDLIADGALGCQWAKPSSDIAVWYAQLTEDDAAWAARSAEVQGTGWTVSDAPAPGTLLAPADYDANYQPSMLHADGVTYFVSYGELLGSVAALQ